MTEETLKELLAFVQDRFKDDSSGHDVNHTLRVYRMALHLQSEEGGDKEIIALASLLHDIDDHKLFDPKEKMAEKWLISHGFPLETVQKVLQIISEVSFKGKDSVVPSSLEGKIVQDADRLDAIGALGIARAFEYGGKHNRKDYDPNEKPLLNMDEETYRNHVGTTINHFYEKLLLLQEMMNTEEAKRLANQRTIFMKEFLDEFKTEWEGKR